MLRYPASIDLDETTRLSWQWRVIELLPQVKEDCAAADDFLSIAVEFNNSLGLAPDWIAVAAFNAGVAKASPGASS
jgi:hypothetical protein